MSVQVLTDYKKLEYFMTTKKLTPRQVRWAELLLEFNFVISYQSSKKNNKVNVLMQKPKDCLTDKKDKQLEHWMHMLLSPEHFEQSVELQPIEEKEKNNRPSTKTSNLIGQPDPVEQTRSSEKNSILLEQVINAN